MVSLIVFSALLQLAFSAPDWLPKCGSSQRQNLLDVISTDIFVRHLNSGALNATLTECSNFHRHLCPKQGPPSSASIKGLFDQIAAIERSCTKYDVLSKIEASHNFTHFGYADQFDHFDYSNKAALSAILFLLPKSTLIAIYEYTTLHMQQLSKFYSNVWDRRHWTAAKDQEIFPAKYDSSIFTNLVKRKEFVDSLADKIKNITETNNGMKNMAKVYLPFIKDVTDYNHIVRVEFREGFANGFARDRFDNTVIKVAAEYGRRLKNATWSSVDYNGKTRYDRFYDELVDIYENTLNSSLNNLSVQNSYSTFSRDFYNFYLEERSKLSSLRVLPHLRNMIAVNRAHERVIATIDLSFAIRWQIVASPTLPNVLSGFFVWICVRNQAIFDRIVQNSPDSAVFGVIGYTYAHEMYHGVERDLYPTVMPDSPVVSISMSCVKSYYLDDIVPRFPGIAYGAFKTALGDRIDEVAYPSSGITHRQLFFYANSIFGCNVHDEMKINGGTVLIDAHYEVNGRLAQVPEFKTTFQCSSTENMVIPESDHCPIFFPSFTA